MPHTTSIPKLIRRQEFVAVAIFLLISLAVGYFTLTFLEKNARESVVANLHVAYTVTEDAYMFWLEQSSQDVRRATNDWNLQVSAELLGDLPKNPDTLRHHPEQFTFDQLAMSHITRSRGEDMQLIDASGLTIASQRLSKVGHLHPVSIAYPELLEKALSGEVTFVPTTPEYRFINNEAVVADNDKVSVYLLSPISSFDGHISSVIALEFNAKDDFSSIAQRARTGVTMETYGVNEKGVMITNSRFNDELYAKRLLKPGEEAALNIQVVANPFREEGTLAEPTHMMRSLFNKSAGQSLLGYKDYRGEMVLGVWNWIDSMNFGLAIEIDEDEALAGFYTTQQAVIWTGSLFILLSVALLLFVASLRNKSQLAISTERQTLRDVINVIPHMIYARDGHGRFLLANESQARFAGMSVQELEGQTVHEVFEDLSIRNLMLKLDKDILNGKLSKLDRESTHIDATGVARQYLSTRMPVSFRDGKGDIIPAVLGVLIDITDLKKAQQAIASSEASLNAILDNAPLGIEIKSASGNLVRINAAMEQLLGYTRAEYEALELEDFVFSDDLEKTKRSFRNILSGLVETTLVETRLVRKDNEVVWAQISMRVIRDKNNDVVNIIVLYQDFSERKHAELELQNLNADLENRVQRRTAELEFKNRELDRARATADEANEAKSLFLANMSHELRTPLNAIIGLTELTIETPLDDEQRKYLENVHTSALKLLAIVNDILDLTKVESGKIELEAAEFSLTGLIRQVASMVSHASEKKNLELITDVDPRLPDILFGDQLRLGQVLTNLMSNAVKFTSSGYVKLDVAIENMKDTHCRVCFKVIDTGIGIPEEKRKLLFQSFSQVDASMTRKFGGTGLGLSISRQLVRLMGSDIQVSSAENEGSTFAFGIDFKCDPSSIADFNDLQKSALDVVSSSSLLLAPVKGNLESLDIKIAEFDSLAQLSTRSSESIPFATVGLLSGEEEEAEIREVIRSSSQQKTFLILIVPPARAQHVSQLSDYTGFRLLTYPLINRELLKLLSELKNTALSDLAPTKTDHTKPAVEALAKGQVLEGANILVVEDNLLNQQVVKALLEKENATVVLTNNGQEALDVLQSNTFDLVLMDIQMPVMDGYQAVKEIRNTPELSSMVVVALTANALDSDVEKSLQAGFDAHLSKPLRKNKLMETLLSFLNPA